MRGSGRCRKQGTIKLVLIFFLIFGGEGSFFAILCHFCILTPPVLYGISIQFPFLAPIFFLCPLHSIQSCSSSVSSGHAVMEQQMTACPTHYTAAYHYAQRSFFPIFTCFTDANPIISHFKCIHSSHFAVVPARTHLVPLPCCRRCGHRKILYCARRHRPFGLPYTTSISIASVPVPSASITWNESFRQRGINYVYQRTVDRRSRT